MGAQLSVKKETTKYLRNGDNINRYRTVSSGECPL